MNRTTALDTILHDFGALHRSMGMKNLTRPTTLPITPAQYAVLFVLARENLCTVKDVARAFSITSSAATQMIDGLVARGYAVRRASDHDRRLVVLVLSPKGRAVVTRMHTQIRESARAVFNRLTDAELKQYCILTKKLVGESASNHL